MPGTIDVRMTVYKPDMSAVTCLDAYSAGDFYGGVVQYEDTPSGCGAAKITLGIRYEEMKSRGYYRGMSIVEISSGDNTLKTSAAAGANKYYLNEGTWAFDPAQGEDAQQAYFYDGATLTMRVPVTGVGTDAGGAYITTSAPLGGGSVPAYSAGTIVGRRRYAGRIVRRSINVQRLPGNIDIQCVGLSVGFTQAYGTFTIGAAANVDMATAIYTSLSQFTASHWPFFAPFTATQFPTSGYPYHGTLTNVGCDRLISDALGAVSSADQFFVRVGHDRQPRLVKLFTASTTAYTYNVTLTQGATEYEPVSISIDDEDCSAVATDILVTGDTDPATNQPVTAIVQDPTAAAFFGFQIDAAPVNNMALKDVTGAANYGLGQLDEYALPVASNKMVVFTKNDTVTGPTPGNMTTGDVVRASACVTVAAFDQAGLVTNAAPDSVMQYTTGTSGIWSTGAGSLLVGGSPDGYNAWSIPANGVSQGPQCPKTPAAPGQTWTFTGFIDASGITGSGGVGTVQWFVGAYDKNGNYLGNAASVSVAMGAAAVTPPPITFSTPAGTASLVAFMYVQGAAGRSGSAKFAQPNLVQGASIKPYVVNLAAPNVIGLPSSVVTMIDLDKHDTQQQVTFAAIEPSFSGALAEAANAVSTALRANSQALNSLDSYCVSRNAANYTVSATSLTVTFPALAAIWAPSTGAQAPVSVPLTNVTLAASSTNWVWLLSNSTYAVFQTATPVQGAILMAIFQTSATGWIGDSGLKASIGVLQIGFGNINASSTIPAPTVSATPSIANGASLSGLAAAVDVSLALNNVPTDGSVSQILWLYRQSMASGGSGQWVPFEAQNLTLASGSKYPLGVQTQSFEYDLNNGTTYDFGVAYYGLSGYGPILYVYANWTVKAIGIPNAYMLAGSSPIPTFAAGASATAAGSNGLAAAMQLSFTINNQPTDGSLSRINVWRTSTAVPGVWDNCGAFGATGVGTASPPASASYTFTALNLVNGVTYGFGVTFENAQGGDTSTGSPPVPNPAQFATATAQTITIKQQYLIGNASPTPTVTAVGGGIGSAATLPGVAARVALNFSVSNQPTDGSFAAVVVLQKQHSAPTASFAPIAVLSSSSLGVGVTPLSSGTYYIELPEAVAGIAYDFAFAFQNTQGAQSATFSTPSFCQNYTAQAIAITNGYMLGTTLTPTVSGTPTATNVTSGDGVSAAVQVAFTCNNQPTDGSLSRIQLWAQPHGASSSNTVGAAGFYWSPQGAQQATGVGTASPPASAAYGFVLAYLTNGTTYDFAVSYENAQGGETTLLPIVSGFVAQALNITPGQTSFSRLLTSTFYGLSIDQGTGLLVMPAGGASIYPSSQVATPGPISYLGPALAQTPLVFTMRFQLSNISSTGGVSAAILTDAASNGSTFNNGYYVNYVPNNSGGPGTLNLYKKVAGTSNLVLQRSAAQASVTVGGTTYPGVGALPTSDGFMHELKVVATGGSLFSFSPPRAAASGICIQVYLDGVWTMLYSETDAAAATAYGPTGSNITYAGNIGGVATFQSGLCGPGVNAYFAYLDEADLSLKSSAGAIAETFSQQNAQIVKSQQQMAVSGSPTPLAIATVARESMIGATGEGTNQIYNPTAARGLNGWNVGDTTGGLGVASYDGQYGGRFTITLPVATYPAANSAVSIYEFLNGAPLLPSTTYTVSGWIAIDSIQAGASIEVYLAQLPSGATGTTSVTLTAAQGATFFSFTFTTSATAMGTGTAAPFIALENFSGTPAHTTVATVAHFLKLMIEQGSIATGFADSFSGNVTTQTHDQNGNIIAGLSKSTALRGQSSALPVSSGFLTTATPTSSKASYGNNGSPTPGATYAKIVCSWGAWSITYPDNTTFSFGAFSGGSGVFVSGVPGTSDATVPLLCNTSYYLTAFAAYGSGTVTTAFTTGLLSQTEAAALFADGCVTLVVNYGPITTPAQPASGTVPGTPGNPPANTCPAVGQLMHTRRGYVLAEDLIVGDELCDWEAGVFNVVHSVRREPCEVFRVVIEGEAFLVDKNHEWAWEHGWWKTRDLAPGDHVINADGGTLYVDSVENIGMGEYVKLHCDRQRYRIGSGPVGHNNRTT